MSAIFPLNAAEPDFAYPKQSIGLADKLIAKAATLKGVEADTMLLRGLLIRQRALSEIDPGNLKEFYSEALRTDSEMHTALGRGFGYLLQAKTLQAMYSDRQYSYDRVEVPLEPVPADPAEWSGQQFKARIGQALQQALAEAASPLFDMPVGDARSFLDVDGENIYTPTVRDALMFMAYRTAKAAGLDDEARAIAAKAVESYEKLSPGWFHWRLEQLGAGGLEVPESSESPVLAFYEEYADVPEARQALLSYVSNDSSDNSVVAKVDLIRQSLSKFPDNRYNPELSNVLANLTAPTVEVCCSNLVCPGVPFKMRLKSSWCRKAGVRIYRSTGNKRDDRDIAKMRPVAVSEVDIDPDAYQAETEIEITLNEAGLYVIIPIADGNEESDTYWRSYLTCSEFVPIVFGGTVNQAVAAASWADGAPVAGVDVSGSNYLGRTNSEGLLPLKLKQYANLTFTYKGRKQPFDDGVYLSPYREYGDEDRPNCTFFTDRPIYRPGQEVQWAVIVSEGKKVKPDFTVTVKFCDANGQLIAQDTLTTDSMGRIDGKFEIPSDRLTGNYSLEVISDKERYLGSTSVCISDFRMPTFRIEELEALRDEPTEGCVRLKGRAMTYSGMPVADAAVAVVVSKTRRFFWYAQSQPIGTLDGTTDSDGRFEIVVPRDMTEPYAGSDLMAAITVTSKANEIAEASKLFTLGKPYEFSMKLDGKVNIDRPVANPILAFDSEGREASIEATWRLLSVPDSILVASGAITAGDASAKIDFGKVAVGNYIFEVEAVDASMANSATAPISLYSIARNEVPPTQGVFVVQGSSIEADDYGTCAWKVGVSAPTIAYLAKSAGSELLSVEKVVLKPGFTDIKATIPKAYQLMRLSLVTVSEGLRDESSITFKRPDRRKVSLQGESFRDRLVPGSAETWRLKFTDADGRPIPGALVATLFNESLLALNPMGWPTGMYYPVITPQLRVGGVYKNDVSCSFRIEPKLLKTPVFGFPQLRYFVGYFAAYQNIMFCRSFEANKMMSGAMLAAKAEDCEDEICMEDASFDTDSPADGGATPQSKPEVELRPVDVMQAFWRPAVVIGPDGIGEISFTVPDANTTWALRAFAWTADKRSTSLSESFLANRPVMVKPTLPRFLRQGDTAFVQATVYNNTDDELRIYTRIEVFDPQTGAILRTADHTVPVAAGASVLAGIDIEVPTTTAMLGLRVRSTADGFTDGEQGLIPVLEAATTVVEAQTFYLNPGDESYTMTVPDAKDMTSTLQFCQNPIWTVVKAMRELPAKATTAIDAVNALFAAELARYIDSRCPAIARTLKVWKENPSDSAAVSMLQRNGDLKLLGLDNTPWLQTAQNQTARMQALSNVFSAENLTSNIALQTKALRELQTSGGGFRWGQWSDEPSYWTTECVLMTMALARSLGATDVASGEMFDMLSKAWTWYQSEQGKNPSHALAIIPALMPELKLSAASAKKVDTIVAHIAKSWKHDSTADKAWDALVLNAYGHTTEANRVLASVREFGVHTPDRGITFPSVNDIRGYATIIQAFAKISPVQAELDAMRQWVIVRQQANDDFGAYAPDYIIAALLLTGSDWTTVPTETRVTLGGETLMPSNAEYASGYFTMTLSEDARGKLLTVASNGVTPAYGSVTSIGIRPITEVKAVEGRDLKIEKRLLVQRDGEWVEPSDIRAGERVRVLLTLTARVDMEYVTLVDPRAAALDPVKQTSSYTSSGGLWMYRENRDTSTRMFISYLPKGVYQIGYDCTAMFTGRFCSGPATVQSQYAPELTAHSAGRLITVK